MTIATTKKTAPAKSGGLANLAGLKSLSSLNKKISESGLDTLKSVPIDEVISKAQVRKQFTGIEELADNIREVGLQVPINVTRKNEEGKYVIIQGERRWRACKLAGLTTIEVVVRHNPKDDQERMLLQLSENLQRSDMEIFEVGEALAALEATGLKNKEIAQRLGKSESFVTRALQVAGASPEVKDMCRKAGVVDLVSIANVIKMDAHDHDKTAAKFEEGIEKGENFTRVYVKDLFDEIMSRKKSRKAKKSAKEKAAAKAKQKPAYLIPEGVKPAASVQYVSKVGFIDKATGEDAEGYLTPDYVCDDDFRVCVIYQKKLTTMLVQDLTYLGQVPITEFES